MSKVNKTASKITTRRLVSLTGTGRNKLTLRQFSEKCGMGQSTMHNYLKGRDIKGTFLIKIAKACGCTTDYLLGIREMTPIDDATMKLKMLVNEAKAHSAGMDKFIKTLGV